MKINTCIHDLLLENETVIIPGFGAFISHYKPAEILPENDEIKPPSKTLSFNQKIRNNDGLLVGYIAHKEAISHFDALKVIEKDREDMIYQLDKGERITFENIGVLFRNENNEIEFESFQQENLLLDSFGLDTTSLTQDEPVIEEEAKNEPVVEAVTDEEPAPPVSEETVTDEPGVEEVTREEAENISEETNIVESENLIDSELEKEQETIPGEPADKPAPVLENITESMPMQEEPKEKKKFGWLWFLLIFIPIVVAGIFLYTKQNQDNNPTEIKQENPVSENEIVKSEEIPAADTVKYDTVKTELASTIQTESQKANQTMATETKNRGNYYLVGGSFKEEENADKFMQEFNAEGYTPFKLGKRGNFYIIAIGRFNTEKEAVVAQNKFIEENPNSGTWVYKDEPK